MSARHTPGPWVVEATRSALWVGPKKAFSDKVADVVVCVDCGPEYRTDFNTTAAANARLIAASPELLGALRFILAFYEPGQTYLDTEAWKVAEASARRAVAKAEGSPMNPLPETGISIGEKQS